MESSEPLFPVPAGITEPSRPMLELRDHRANRRCHPQVIQEVTQCDSYTYLTRHAAMRLAETL